MITNSAGWVFISHSHQDIALVRRIRNHLEGLGFEPVMFYLKCLSDEDEIETLIKREIDQREWFIYADSPNSRKSKWVKTEREYIETLDGKKVFTIDLSANLAQQFREVEHIARQMKVFISYAHDDTDLMLRFKEHFTLRDMQVLTDRDISAGSHWAHSVSSDIAESSRNGFVVVLITEQSAKSKIVQIEIEKAVAAKGKIVPIFVGNAKVSNELLSYIGDVQGYTISKSPSDAELEKVIEKIIQKVEYYHCDFRNSYSFRSAESIRLPNISRIDSLTFWDCANLKCVYIPDTVIYISGDAFQEHPNILVKCSVNSYAAEYCKRNNIRYELIE